MQFYLKLQYDIMLMPKKYLEEKTKMAKKQKTPGGLTKKHWFGYMFGDFGGCMTFALMASIFSVYCTDILHVDKVVLGVLVAIWTVWDAINDPIMGALMDKAFAKNQNKRGKFRPWLLRATPLLAVTAMALWTVPTFFEGITLLVVLFSCKILYEAAYTMFNIPMGSLLSAMSKNDAERASLASARGVGSMFGNAIPGLVAPLVISMFGDDNSIGYSIAGVACAAIGFVVCLLHYAMTEERTVVGESVKADDIKITDIITVVRKNRPFVALCIHGIAICTMQYLASGLGIYMYKAVYHDVAYQTLGSALSMPFMIGAMVVVPFICKKLGLEKVIRYSLLISGGIFAILFGMHLVMYVSPLVHGVIMGLASGMSMVSIQMQWGLVGEAIDYNEMVVGKRTEGSIYGTFNLSRRLGQTVGSSGALFALALIQYNENLPVQTDFTIFGFKFICVLLPGLCVLLSWFAFKFVWNITPEKRAEMAAFKAGKPGATLEGAVVPEAYN
jgi:GPH family glycoside/pentoside/hexuronide:cation symporter